MRVDRLLALFAAPTFAVMGLLSATVELHQPAFCSELISGGHSRGMAAMYALMSVFHLRPWVRLIAKRAQRHG
jgi:hypothetical protein